MGPLRYIRAKAVKIVYRQELLGMPMSVVSRFHVILISVILMLLGLDIVVAYHGLLSMPFIISSNLVVLGFLIIVRGVQEHMADERRFYLLWGLIMFVIALSILVGSLAGLAIGVAFFLIGLGTVFLYITTRSSP